MSSPEIHEHEWASFSTRDFPGNRHAQDGDRVRIVMLDVPDRRPVEDVLCSDAHYRDLFSGVGLGVGELVKPLGTSGEGIEWVTETRLSPWSIHVLGPGDA